MTCPRQVSALMNNWRHSVHMLEVDLISVVRIQLCASVNQQTRSLTKEDSTYRSARTTSEMLDSLMPQAGVTSVGLEPHMLLVVDTPMDCVARQSSNAKLLPISRPEYIDMYVVLSVIGLPTALVKSGSIGEPAIASLSRSPKECCVGVPDVVVSRG